MPAEDDEPGRIRPMRLALAATLGAVVAEVAVVFSEGLTRTFAIEQVPGHLLAIGVGALIGWLIELARQLAITAQQTLVQIRDVKIELEMLAAKLDSPARLEEMVNASPGHVKTLRQLTGAASREKFSMIPKVGPGEYLRHLQKAISESTGYFGVQRRPIHWYRDANGSDYLDALDGRPMSYKVRLFVIDDEDREEMESDLNDVDLMSYYWTHSSSVESYWATVSQFQRLYPALTVPNDFALYDAKLLIQYDEDAYLLQYNIVDSRWNERILQNAFMTSPAPSNGRFQRIFRPSPS